MSTSKYGWENKPNNLKPCPFCGSQKLKDCYVYIKCETCGTEGPKTNNGNFDDHADWVDHEHAIELWNKRTRKMKEKKCPSK